MIPDSHAEERKADHFLNDKKRGIVAVPIPDCYQPPESQDNLDKRVRIRLQGEEARAQHRVKCHCGKKLQLFVAYKCLYCGEWYCTTCAEIHFGETKAQWLAKKQFNEHEPNK